jgi:hypothetical protein
MRKTFVYLVLVVVALLVITALIAGMRPGANLVAEYAERLDSSRRQIPTQRGAPLTLADVAKLPAPVQRYLQRSGTIGKPPVRAFYITYDAEMFQQPGSSGMPGPAEQFNLVQPFRRLFFMRTRMSGLPVAVLHDYAGTEASMRVRIARLFDVVNLRSTEPAHTELARTETVTLLNDLCFFAPSALLGPQFNWRAIDDSHTEVIFTNGPHTVHATLVFDGTGDLLDFVSDDRGELQRDGKLVIRRWSTPMQEIREFDGRRVPTRGEAIWHRPEGPFIYGRMVLQSIQFD